MTGKEYLASYNVTARMLEAMRQRQVNGQSQSVSLAIDETECSQVINFPTAFRSIMGVVYSNHMLSNPYITKDEIKYILDKK